MMLENKRSKHNHSIEQFLINLNLNFYINLIKIRYLKSILQSRSSSLSSYCINVSPFKIASTFAFYFTWPSGELPILTHSFLS